LGNINLFTGLLNIVGSGKVQIDSVARMPGAGALIKIESTGTLYFSLANANLTNNIEMYGGGTGEAIGQLRIEGNATVSGAVTLKANTTVGANTNATGIISGNIGESGGSFGLNKVAAGTLYFTGTNTYTGVTTVSSGTLVVAAPASLPGWNAVGRYSVALGTSLVLGNSFTDANIATMLGTYNFVAGSNFGFDTSDGDRTYAVGLGGSLGTTKTGANALILSGANTYTGKTSVQGGTLSVSSINSVVGGTAGSSPGAPTTVANGTIAIGSAAIAGTLIYTGAGETTDRVINLSGTVAAGGTIDSSGTGPFVTTGGVAATGAGAKTLTLTGTNTGNNTIGGVIADNTTTNKTSLTKSGAGKRFGLRRHHRRHREY